MGIFYNDPQPTQRTPRLPASAFTTGSQPPRKAVAGAIAMACILAAWPAQGEPPLHQQNRNPRQITPLTLTYGQQPPRIDASPRVQANTVRISWPEWNEPRLQFNNQYPAYRRYVVALTLAYGQQPPLIGPLTVSELNELVRWSDPPFQYPQKLPNAATFFVPPVVNNPPIGGNSSLGIISRYYKDPLIMMVSGAGVIRSGPADSPPPNGPLTPTELALLRLSWEQWFQYPESEANSAAWNVPPIAPSAYQPRSAFPWWVQSVWSTPTGDILFAGNFTPDTVGDQPPVSGAITPAEISIVRGSWEPRAEIPARSEFAPLTLVQGQQPPPAGPLSVTELQIIGTIAPWWPAQSEADSAGWNFVPPIVSQPPGFTPQRHIARLAWEPVFQLPQELEAAASWNVPPSAFVPTSRLQLYLVSPQIDSTPQMRRLLVPGVSTRVVAGSGVPMAVLVSWRDVAQFRYVRWVAHFAGTSVTETTALTGLIQVMPSLTGIILVEPELAGFVEVEASLRGLLFIRPGSQ